MADNYQPSLFIPHGGGPCFFMDWPTGGNVWQGMQDFLAGLAKTLPAKPKAILVISGHWEEPEFTVNTVINHTLYYDYYGFPPHTYQLTYPARGDKHLIADIVQLLSNADIGVQTDNQRGLDHGVFIPFKVIYPDADIPIVQFSLKKGLDPQTHINLGKVLAPLRKEGVLIVGSGMSYHNLGVWSGELAATASQAFNEWLITTLEEDDIDKRNRLLENWQDAPYARIAHPKEEHLLPLMVAVGAGDSDKGYCIYSGKVRELSFSAFRFG